MEHPAVGTWKVVVYGSRSQEGGAELEKEAYKQSNIILSAFAEELHSSVMLSYTLFAGQSLFSKPLVRNRIFTDHTQKSMPIQREDPISKA